ncbi:secreted RxLR effector protein 161-like [Nicotiana tabacum]|uniref:Secreted RxLR effector protein 161-like n=1 Tax=Nicotiana tabacum TaxID=4097 RepID=A0AC58SN37_TOBAC
MQAEAAIDVAIELTRNRRERRRETSGSFWTENEFGKEKSDLHAILSIIRHEIAYSVGIVSQFMQCPRSSHLDAARRILRYVKSSLDHGLMYGRHEEFVLSGFTDADWAEDVNDRHSTSGYCFSTGSAMVSWCSKKQAVVALSSTKVEYVAATMAAHECIWLKILIGEMLHKVDYAVQLRCDNESVVKLVSNPIFHGRTKHIDVRHHYIR